MSEKYAFVGSHGTGKSSAATHLAAVLKQHDPSKSVKVIEENVREIARMVKGDMNSPAFQKLCMVDHLTKEFTAAELYDQVVCDRTALDTLIYGLVYDIALPPEYFSLAINHLNSFDTIFFVRPSNETEIADDGFRDTDVDRRKAVDFQFEKMLKLWGGKYIEINTKDVFDYQYLKALGKR